MAAELVTPTDEFSGLPLPLLPLENELPIDQGDIANWHHHFHPRTDPVLFNTVGGRALRSARIQLVATTQHNYSEMAYHKFFKGPEIPADRDTQFGLCVLSCAGFLPEDAVDTSTGEPRIVRMTNEQQAQLRVKPEASDPEEWQVEKYRRQKLPAASLDEVRRVLAEKWQLQAELSYRNLRYGYDPMKAFFTEVVLVQDVSHLPECIIEEFVETGSMKPGLVLLSQAAVQAVETAEHRGQKVSDLYRVARSNGYLHNGMPPNAASLVKYKLGDLSTRVGLLPRLRQQLGGMAGPIAA